MEKYNGDLFVLLHVTVIVIPISNNVPLKMTTVIMLVYLLYFQLGDLTAAG